jgi:putative transposase
MPWQETQAMDQRKEFAVKAMKTEDFAELCREYGISRETGYKWRRRLVEEGLGGMGEKSRRPKSSPHQLTEDVVCRLLRLRYAHPTWGARKLVALYARQWPDAPSESSAKRVLKKAGLLRKSIVRRASAGGRVNSGRKAQACNEVWTVDFKGWWHDVQGKCEPLTVRDEFSRYVLAVQAVANARTQTVRAVFEDLFARYGLPRAIRSDNGPPFAASQGLLGLSQLSVWWLALGIELERSRPGCPQDNGGHERMHWDLCREVEGVRYEGRQATLDQWRQVFNDERPHEALGMRTPSEVYQPSPRRFTGTPEQVLYENMSSRRVHRSGTIRYAGRTIFLSRAVAGWDVGLHVQGAALAVYFGPLLLGHLEVETASFRPIHTVTQTAAAAPTGPTKEEAA